MNGQNITTIIEHNNISCDKDFRIFQKNKTSWFKNNISIDEIKDEVEEDFAREASTFANQGQNELPEKYDSSDDDAIVEGDKILEHPEEDNIEVLEKLVLKSKN